MVLAAVLLIVQLVRDPEAVLPLLIVAGAAAALLWLLRRR